MERRLSLRIRVGYIYNILYHGARTMQGGVVILLSKTYFYLLDFFYSVYEWIKQVETKI